LALTREPKTTGQLDRASGRAESWLVWAKRERGAAVR
jgi:hypothetical protein